MNINSSISYYTDKIKPFWKMLVIILLCVLTFGLWEIHLMQKNRVPLSIANSAINIENQEVFGSKTGTKYYFPWCGSLNRIKAENRVSFASPILAREAGYLPAGNCKGVK